jgi:hypothetical protein
MLVTEFTKRFPHAAFHPEWRLMTSFPTGPLDDETAEEFVEFIELAEKYEGKPFNRFADMSGHTRIQIGLGQVVRLARRRRRYKGPPVKSAFFAVRLISITIAHMYAELMEGSKIQVCIFRDRSDAAAWLGVPRSVLLPPKAKSS